MTKRAYLTPEFPSAGFICRRLLIPNGEDILAIVNGAINELIYSYNFEQYGTMTPDETASMFLTMFDNFVFDGFGGCRVIGEIIPYAGDTSPKSEWLLCDGSSVLRADYPDLFAIVGSSYGSADGTHFNVPDLRGRVPMGMGQQSGGTDFSIGDTGGEETHVLTVSELASHTHTDTGHTHVEGNATASVVTIGAGAPAPTAVPSVGVTGSGTAAITSSGSDSAHNNLQPYLAINYLIVAS